MYTDTWTINGKEFTFADRQALYEELLKRGMIKEKPELTVDDMEKEKLQCKVHSDCIIKEPHFMHFTYFCEHCHDTGIIKRTEWVGTDSSYVVDYKCECQKQ